jgi:DNA-binding NarL/FixJ family response regulator
MTYTGGRPIRVLIVDDHPILREGLAAVLGNEPEMLLVGQACDGREALQMFLAHRPDVTLMDLQMPHMDGVAATVAIRAQCSDARILILTTYKGDAQTLRALKAGACGYLLKSTMRTDLLHAIRSVHAGRRHVTHEVAAELAGHVSDDALSQRELEVLRLVAAGNSNRRVAVQLAVSEDTVKSHMKSIMSKLAANDRTHSVTIALKRGIIEL